MNTSLFSSLLSRLSPAPAATAKNAEGAKAYAFDVRHALAQYAATGCMNDTFYADASQQLETVLRLADGVPATFIAKTALYARERGFMKDLPAVLVALLSVEDPALCERVFDRVIDNGKMLRNFVQVLRSGAVGRKSLGSMPKRLVKRWIDARDDDALIAASVGDAPSLADVIRLAHPKPASAERAALMAWILGRPHDVKKVPEKLQALAAYRAGRTTVVPDVPMALLTSLELDRAGWTAVARRATWTQTRMNLSSFARHDVFKAKGMEELIAARLRDEAEVKRARVFPYQLMMAYVAAEHSMPRKVRHALERALDLSLGNVPSLGDRKVVVCPDVSGSMQSPVTGARKGATTKVRCIDVAALMAAAMLRNNRDAEVLPFEEEVVEVKLRAADSVMTNAEKLSRIGGGGTACSAPLAHLNERNARADLVVFISDNESWCDPHRGRGTAMMEEWARFKRRNPRAKLVCIDLQPNSTSQVPDRRDVLNVGGFSDSVFDLLARTAATEGLEPTRWVRTIEAMTL